MSSTGTRARADSGLIDLIAIDRDARAQMQADTVRKKAEDDARSMVPPPVMRDIGVIPDDVDSFESAMSNPFKKQPRTKIALGVAAVLLFLVGGASLASSTSGPTKKELVERANAAAEAAKVADAAQAAAAAAAIKAATPRPVATPAAVEPAKTVKVANTSSSSPSSSKGAKPRKAPARAHKGGGGPKMIKVQSGGVEAAS